MGGRLENAFLAGARRASYVVAKTEAMQRNSAQKCLLILDPGARPELHLPNAAAQTRIGSVVPRGNQVENRASIRMRM
jgi:hypothetical protein